RGRIREWLNINLVQTSRIESVVPTRHYFALMVLVRVTQHDLELKTIELCLRQWIRSFVFDRILSREYREDRRQGIGIAVDCDLAFFHRFQQRGLRFGRRTVDLVCQQDVGEYRTTPQVERRVCDVEDIRPGDI